MSLDNITHTPCPIECVIPLSELVVVRDVSRDTMDMNIKTDDIQIKKDLSDVMNRLDKLYSNETSSSAISQILGIFDIYRGYKHSISRRNGAQNVNNSWMKIWEIISHHRLIPSNSLDESFITLDACALPGSSVLATHHYVRSMTNIKSHLWLACGGNETKDCYQLRKNYRNRWIGARIETLDDIEQIAINIGLDQAHLFVCEHIEDSKDYNNQEEHYTRKYIGYILLMFEILKQGGNAIIKQYGMFNPITQSLISILDESFETIHIYKPTASRITNIENYVICKNFTGVSRHTLSNLRDRFKSQTIDSTAIIPITENVECLVANAIHTIHEGHIKAINIALSVYDKISSDYPEIPVTESPVWKSFKILNKTQHTKFASMWSNFYNVKSIKNKDKLKVEEIVTI